MPGGDPADAAENLARHEERLEHTAALEAHFLLWRATRVRDHLRAARGRLDYLVEHAPEEYRESMRKNVRLHREIMEAWAEHGGKE